MFAASSGGISVLDKVVASISYSLSFSFTLIPNFLSWSRKFCTSRIFGMFPIVHFPSISKHAESIGNAAFFAPDIFTSPLSILPPFTSR